MAAKKECKCVTIQAKSKADGRRGMRYKRSLCWGKATKTRAGGIVSNKECR
jgi:hypothetical protein